MTERETSLMLSWLEGTPGHSVGDGEGTGRCSQLECGRPARTPSGHLWSFLSPT